MGDIDDCAIQISGSLTSADWHRERPAAGAAAKVWECAFQNYFEQRLRLRYLDAVRLLEEKGGYEGVGFSIVAILCSLLEFLESTACGLNYRFVQKSKDLGPYEYNRSGKLIISFLTTRSPFSGYFDESLADAFYRHIRCGLLHEASTKDGWRIWVRDPDDRIIDPVRKILYRNNFRFAIEEYVAAYGCELATSTELQSAFLRKFDHLAALSSITAADTPIDPR